MAGPIETGGEVAKEAVRGLTGTPALLALVIMQAVLLGIVVYGQHERNQYESKVNDLLVTMCKRGLLEAPSATEGRPGGCSFR